MWPEWPLGAANVPGVSRLQPSVVPHTSFFAGRHFVFPLFERFVHPVVDKVLR